MAMPLKQPVNSVRLNPQAKDNLFRKKDRSLWNFWRDGVSSSFLFNFMTCREQTRLVYVEGWSSRAVPMAFEFGSCMHWVFEQAYVKTRAVPTPEQILGWVKAYEQLWLRNVPTPTLKQLEQQELAYGMAESVLPYYFDRWEGDFTGAYRWGNNTTAPVTWHSLEEVFSLPYTFPDGKKTVLRGKRDGVFIDRRGRFWVFDTKCRSVINHDEALETLPFDTQQMLYLYATALEMKTIPAGTIMNIVRRPGQRRGDGEELPPFLGRMRKDISNPKRYDHYFIRYEMAIGRDEIIEWKAKHLDPLMEEVRMWWEGTAPHYMNPNALLSKYGRCAMYSPIVRQDFSQCYRRQYAFNELTENI